MKRWEAFLPAETATPAETRALGARLADGLQPGDVLALYGALGAGKTQLVKGLCAALGISEDEVTSPTFTLVNEYASGRFPVYHMDAYRITRLEECYEFGFEDYLYGPGLTIIEWPERVEPLLPPEAHRLRLTHRAGDKRRIEQEMRNP